MVFYKGTGDSSRWCFIDVSFKTIFQPAQAAGTVTGACQRIEFSQRSCINEYVFLWITYFPGLGKCPKPVLEMAAYYSAPCVYPVDRLQQDISSAALFQRRDGRICGRNFLAVIIHLGSTTDGKI